MKKIITATGNIELFNELENNDQIKLVCNDIIYKEGIIEKLEEDNNIDFIIINEIIPGNIDINELIYLIKLKNKKIKIILISEEECNGVDYYLNKINYEKIINIILNNKINNNFIIFDNYKKIEKNKINNKNNYFENNLNNILENKKIGKIISVIGTGGIGKSIFSISYAKEIKNKKILIVDFDLMNNTTQLLLDTNSFISNNNEKINNYSDLIKKTKYDIDVISGINFLINNEEENINNINNFINYIKNYYEIIIFDTTNELLNNYLEKILLNSDEIIFISGANILEIKKSISLLEKYCIDWNIEKRKINIVFNKYTKQSVDEEIIKNIFSEFNVIGKIKNTDFIDNMVNSNNIKINKIKKEINKIKKKLESTN